MGALVESEWSVLHGDSVETPIWAVLTDSGNTFDLTGWWVRAQARSTADAPTPQHSWTIGDGVDIGTAVVQVKGRPVSTSTVQLYLTPSDYEDLDRRYSGVVDIEAASDQSDHPAERHTLVRFAFRVEPDVTRLGA